MRLRNFLNLCKLYLLQPRNTYQIRRKIRVERLVSRATQDIKNLGFSHETLYNIALAKCRFTEELYYWTSSKIRRMAAARILAEEGRWDLRLAAEYAWTGYQGLIKNDPLMGNIRPQYDGGPLTAANVNGSGIVQWFKDAKVSDLRRISPDFLRMLLPRSDFRRSHIGGEIVRALAAREESFARCRSQMTEEQRKLLDEILHMHKKEMRQS